jgi:hypothetical protein
MKNFNWLLDNFVGLAAGVCDAVAVSSDGSNLGVIADDAGMIGAAQPLAREPNLQCLAYADAI